MFNITWLKGALEMVLKISLFSLQAFGDVFGVDAHTGELYLKSALDFEKTESYSLTVTARDQGPNSLPAYAKVTISDKNQNF